MMTKKYAFVNQKGGVGKSTLCTNVAAQIARQIYDPSLPAKDQRRVLVIDLDPQGHAARALGVETGDRCIGDFLLEKKVNKKVVGFRDVCISADRPADGIRRPNLFLLPASRRLKQSKELLSLQDYNNFRDRHYDGPRLNTILTDMLGGYAPNFEYIFIDCPPTLDTLADATYDFADAVIVPVKMAYLDTDGARQQLAEVLQAQADGIDIVIKYIVPTFFRKNEVVAREIITDLAKLYRQQLVRPIPQSNVIEKAQAAGQRTIFEFEDLIGQHTPFGEAVQNLVTKVMA